MGLGWKQPPGAGEVDSVNGIAPVGGNVTLTAADVPSDGPSDTQADLDDKKIRPISTLADLEARYGLSSSQTTANDENYSLVAGQVIAFEFDGGPAIEYTVVAGDFGGDPSTATAADLAAALDTAYGPSGDAVVSGSTKVAVSSATGPTGSVRVGSTSTAAALAELGLVFGGVYDLGMDVVEFLPIDTAALINIGVDRISCTFPGTLVGLGKRFLISSACRGPVVSGPESLTNIRIRNTNTVDVEAMAIALTSPSGRPINITDSVLIGKDPGTISNCPGGYAISLFTVATVDGTRPLRFSGNIGGGEIDIRALQVHAPGVVDHVALEIPDGTTVSGLTITGFYSTIREGDRFVKIGSGIVLASDLVIRLRGTDQQGPASPNGFFFTGPGFLDSSSSEVFSLANTGDSSRWGGQAVFEDSVNPVEITHTGGWDVVPFENPGVTSALAEGPENQRWLLNRTSIQVWHFGGIGRLDNVHGALGFVWTMNLERDAGGQRTVFVKAEHRTGLLGPAELWVDVPGSEVPVPLSGGDPAAPASITGFGFNGATQVRLLMLGDIGTQTNIFRYQLLPNGTP